MPVTFQVSNTVPTPVVRSTWQYKDFLASAIEEGRDNKILHATEAPNGYVANYLPNGFVAAAFTAYSKHHHLVISPDDVWIAITTALSRYINAHAEEMREIFVSHQGQKEIEVFGVGGIRSANWEALITQISEQIALNTKNDVQKWIEPDFSTTTELIKTVGSIVLMGAMKKYFSYKISLCCGLPEVTMLGTLEDWQQIREKADRLLEFKQETLRKWHEVLVPILDELIHSFSGNPDKDFWNRIAHETGGGSGPSYLCGWILTFIPFDCNDRYYLNDSETIKTTKKYGKLDTDDVPASAVSVPVKIDDNGKKYKTTFYAGHLFATVGATPVSIQPYLGWVMFHDSQAKNK